jgi:NADP-dependent 3-hydroxy acid dehydrogenase YdfG
MTALDGTVVAITGASSGIGRAIACALRPLGARLVLNALADAELDALREEFGADAVIVAGDIASAQTGRDLLAAALERFGRVDVLINNAGIFRNGPIDGIDLDAMEQMIAVNFTAVVRNSYLFARSMAAQGSGHIINLSSISATLTTPNCGVYAGTKRAVEGFSEALRIELAGAGVRVGVIAPGTTDTELFDRVPGQPRSSNVAVRKLDPADLADAVRYMLERPAHANIPHLRLYSAEQRH